jgi:hypothetical protein
MFHVPLRAARLPVFTPTFLRMTECPLLSSSNKLLPRDAIPFVLTSIGKADIDHHHFAHGRIHPVGDGVFADNFDLKFP